MVTPQRLIFNILILICLAKAHEMATNPLCSGLAFEKLAPGEAPSIDMAGWSYSCTLKQCVQVKLKKGTKGSHNFWTRQDFCNISCPAGKVQCLGGNKNVNPMTYCAATPTIKTSAIKCKGSKTIWTNNPLTQICSLVTLKCNQMVSKNSFPIEEDCQQFCDHDND